MLTASLVLAVSAFAQDRTVSGKVTSAEDGTALPGVNVRLKGTTAGTVTDADGHYTVTVSSSNDVLVFSFIGLETIEIVVGEKSTIDAALASDITQLSELVVVGYGTQDKRTLTSSITTVSEEAIALKPIQSFEE